MHNIPILVDNSLKWSLHQYRGKEGTCLGTRVPSSWTWLSAFKMLFEVPSFFGLTRRYLSLILQMESTKMLNNFFHCFRVHPLSRRHPIMFVIHIKPERERGKKVDSTFESTLPLRPSNVPHEHETFLLYICFLRTYKRLSYLIRYDHRACL